MNLKRTLCAEARKLTTWINAALLAALPFADEIMSALSANLPGLAPYLPENIYKSMGAAVVVVGILRSAFISHKQADK